MRLIDRRLAILVLGLATSAVGVDPNGDEKETCPGGPPGVKAGDVTSSVTEATGIDGVERCLSSQFSQHIISEIEWRCETRHCCQEPCNCSKSENLQESPCSSGTEVSQLRCLVQNRRPQPRFHEWICCEGYVEDPEYPHQCLVTCDINNGNCHQVCTASVDPPHHAVCSCHPGYKEHEEDPKMCTDHDECLTENGGCSDICNNTIGGYTCSCNEGREFVEGSKLKCQDVIVIVPQPATQESSGSNTPIIIGGMVGGIVLLALLILLLIFLLKKKKRAEEEPYPNTAFANRTYGDLDAQGARASVAEYGDTEAEAIKKKLPVEGAVGVINPGYVGEKKALEAAGYAMATPNVYEEIPDIKHRKAKQLNQQMTDSNDGYERPLGSPDRKVPLPGLADEVNMDNPTYNGARPKQQQGVLGPPEYSEIPTPAEVEADPRPPVYSNMGREPVRFKDFQEVKYSNVDDDDLQNHHVDIKDIDVTE